MIYSRDIIQISPEPVQLIQDELTTNQQTTDLYKHENEEEDKVDLNLKKNIEQLSQYLINEADADEYFMDRHDFKNEQPDPDSLDEETKFILALHKSHGIIITSGKENIGEVIRNTLRHANRNIFINIKDLWYLYFESFNDIDSGRKPTFLITLEKYLLKMYPLLNIFMTNYVYIDDGFIKYDEQEYLSIYEILQIIVLNRMATKKHLIQNSFLLYFSPKRSSKMLYPPIDYESMIDVYKKNIFRYPLNKDFKFINIVADSDIFMFDWEDDFLFKIDEIKRNIELTGEGLTKLIYEDRLKFIHPQQYTYVNDYFKYFITQSTKTPIKYFKAMLVDGQQRKNLHEFYNSYFGLITSIVADFYDSVALLSKWDLSIVDMFKFYGVLDLIKKYAIGGRELYRSIFPIFLCLYNLVVYVLPIYYTRHFDLLDANAIHDILLPFLKDDVLVAALDFSYKRISRYLYNMPSFVILGIRESDVFRKSYILKMFARDFFRKDIKANINVPEDIFIEDRLTSPILSTKICGTNAFTFTHFLLLIREEIPFNITRDIFNYIFDKPIHFIEKKTNDASAFRAFDRLFKKLSQRYQDAFDIELYRMYGNLLKITNLNESFITQSLKEKTITIPNIYLIQSIEDNYYSNEFIMFNLAIILSYIFQDFLMDEMDLTIDHKITDIYGGNNLLIMQGNPTPNLDAENDINMLVIMNNLKVPFEIKNWLANIYLILLHNSGHTARNRNILIQLFNYYIFTKKHPITDLVELVHSNKLDNELYKHFLILFYRNQEYSDYRGPEDKMHFSIYQLYLLFDHYLITNNYNVVVENCRSFQNIIFSTRLTFHPSYMYFHQSHVDDLIAIFEKAKGYNDFNNFAKFMTSKWEQVVALMFFMICGDNEPVGKIGALPTINIPDACCSLFQTNYYNEICELQGGNACFLLKDFTIIEHTLSITKKWTASSHPTPTLLYFLIPPRIIETSPYISISSGFTSGPTFIDFNSSLIASRGGYRPYTNEKMFFNPNVILLNMFERNEDNKLTFTEISNKWLLFPMYVKQGQKDIFITDIKRYNTIRLSLYRFLNIADITLNENSAIVFTNEYFLKLLHRMVIQYIQYIDMESEINIYCEYDEHSIPLYNTDIIMNTSLDLLSMGKLISSDNPQLLENNQFIKPAIVFKDDLKQEIHTKWDIVIKNRQYQFLPGTADVKVSYEIIFNRSEQGTTFKIFAKIKLSNININLLEAPIVNSLL